MSNTNAPLTPEQISEFKTSLDEIQSYYNDSLKALINKAWHPNIERLMTVLSNEVNKEVPLYKEVHVAVKELQIELRTHALINETVEKSFLPKINKLVRTLN